MRVQERAASGEVYRLKNEATIAYPGNILANPPEYRDMLIRLNESPANDEEYISSLVQDCTRIVSKYLKGGERFKLATTCKKMWKTMAEIGAEFKSSGSVYIGVKNVVFNIKNENRSVRLQSEHEMFNSKEMQALSKFLSGITIDRLWLDISLTQISLSSLKELRQMLCRALEMSLTPTANIVLTIQNPLLYACRELRPLWRVISGVDRNLTLTETINDGNRDLFESVAFHWWNSVTLSSARNYPENDVLQFQETMKKLTLYCSGENTSIVPVRIACNFGLNSGINKCEVIGHFEVKPIQVIHNGPHYDCVENQVYERVIPETSILRERVVSYGYTKETRAIKPKYPLDIIDMFPSCAKYTQPELSEMNVFTIQNKL